MPQIVFKGAWPGLPRQESGPVAAQLNSGAFVSLRKTKASTFDKHFGAGLLKLLTLVGKTTIEFLGRGCSHDNDAAAGSAWWLRRFAFAVFQLTTARAQRVGLGDQKTPMIEIMLGDSVRIVSCIPDQC